MTKAGVLTTPARLSRPLPGALDDRSLGAAILVSKWASPACASETKPQDCRPMHLAGFTGSARFHSPKSKINGR